MPIKKNIETIVETLPDGKRKNTRSMLQMRMSRTMQNTSLICEAQNSAESSPKKSSILVQVEFAPHVRLEQTGGVIREGKSVVLRCIAEANPDKVTYKWSVGGEEYTVRENRLVLTKVSREDNGKIIKCRVSNSVGRSEDTHTLNIHCKYNFALS